MVVIVWLLQAINYDQGYVLGWEFGGRVAGGERGARRKPSTTFLCFCKGIQRKAVLRVRLQNVLTTHTGMKVSFMSIEWDETRMAVSKGGRFVIHQVYGNRFVFTLVYIVPPD